MSRVFVATELPLDRQVVVKVLPPEVAAGLSEERFKREIQLAAKLQHPHIVPLLSAGAKDGLLYYTMPYIQGESARARLAREHVLPIPVAVRILRDVVDALSYAHARGIVHRDIKPDNVLLSGAHAVVTDFGVSKALSQATSSTTLTSIGVALGSPAYMSPEQAAADPAIDRRSDIYSVGALAYELLTGLPPFAGLPPHQMMNAHISRDPTPVTLQRETIPAALGALVMRCLEKRPEDRFQSADDLLAQLELLATPNTGSPPSITRARRTRRLVLGAAVVLALLAGWAVWAMRPHGTYFVASNVQLTNSPGLELDPAISPDGRFVAFAAGEPGHTRILVRQIAGGGGARVLSDSLPVGQRYPHWSGDGQEISFAIAASLYVVPLFGGVARIVATVPGQEFLAPVLSPDGRQVAYALRDTVYVRAVGESGAKPVASARYPHSIAWAPGGGRIAFASENPQFVAGASNIGNISPSSVWIADLATGTAAPITDATHLNASPAWAPDERGVFFVSSRGGGRDIYFQPLSRSARPRGTPQRLTTGVNAHTLSMAMDGQRLAYTSLVTRSNVWRAPISRSGTSSAASPVTNENQIVEGIGVSPDGDWLAFDSNREGRQHIYKVRVNGGEPVQLTRDSADDFLPAWAPNGRELAYHGWLNGNRDIFVVSADGSERRAATSYPGHEMNPIWSPTGNELLFISDRSGRWELYRIRRSGDGHWTAASQVTHNFGYNGRWAPDGSVIAYLSLVDTTLYVIRSDGSGQRLLYDGHADGVTPNQVAFGRDPSIVYFHAIDRALRHVFYAIPVSGGRPRVVLRFDDPSRQPHRFEFDTDGRYLYFTLANVESDVWMLELTH